MEISRVEAEAQLLLLFGFKHFHDLQWKVIEQLLSGRRILFIERTGFGKSLCYQFPATQFEGVTIVFSPLIALMRDQVRSMQEKKIRAAAIHSGQKAEENEEIIAQARSNRLNILYISPERLENASWISAAREMKIAMIVIDEAHCISVWGQSFRPNYRRIVNLVKLLPNHFPVLATTATATPRVQEDIIGQVGSDLIPIRGELLRHNIGLHVVPVQNEDEKFFWLAEYLPRLTKTGIVYTGTPANADIYSNWLQSLGLKSAAYSGRLDPETRKRIEKDFLSNRYDCVVSTNALGMGIDKPDIRFIIHTQIPQSVIHYYQEIGRAGRDGGEAVAILLYNADRDSELPQSFINGSKPGRSQYEKVITAVKSELSGKNGITKATNLKLPQVSVILADLVEQGIVNEQPGKINKYFYNPDAPALDLSNLEVLRQIQTEELKKMLEYTRIQSCRMQYLVNYLGDSKKGDCNLCDNDKKGWLKISAIGALPDRLKEFRENFFPSLKMETPNSKIIDGVAASYYGTSNVGAALHHSKYESGGDFPEWLITLTLKAYRKHYENCTFDLILFVPPTESGNLVRNFAEKISEALGIPMSDKLTKRTATSPQKVFQSRLSKHENVKDKFIYATPSEVVGKRILLIDDIFDSGHTIKEIGKYLTSIGVEVIAPLVIAKTVGGDI